MIKHFAMRESLSSRAIDQTILLGAGDGVDIKKITIYSVSKSLRCSTNALHRYFRSQIQLLYLAKQEAQRRILNDTRDWIHRPLVDFKDYFARLRDLCLRDPTELRFLYHLNRILDRDLIPPFIGKLSSQIETLYLNSMHDCMEKETLYDPREQEVYRRYAPLLILAVDERMDEFCSSRGNVTLADFNVLCHAIIRAGEGIKEGYAENLSNAKIEKALRSRGRHRPQSSGEKAAGSEQTQSQDPHDDSGDGDEDSNQG